MVKPTASNKHRSHGHTVHSPSFYKRRKCSEILALCSIPLLLLLNFRIVLRSTVPYYHHEPERILNAKRSVQNGVDFQPQKRHTKVLGPGYLPGYTGWARPAFTLAGWFQIEEAPRRSTAGMPWTSRVTCHHVLCQSGGALFDVRAYGPAIITGIVQDLHDGTYKLSMLFFDEGVYTVEWVVAFSKAPSLDTFPRSVDIHYEGYLLPGFPLTVEVTAPTVSWYQQPIAAIFSESSHFEHSLEPPSSEGGEELNSQRLTQVKDDSIPKPACTSSDILLGDATSILREGRWLIQDRVTDPVNMPNMDSVDHYFPHDMSKNNTQVGDDKLIQNPFTKMNVSLEGYQKGYNSIGFRMVFERLSCYLPTMEEIRPRLDSRKRHLIMIGDSNMGRQGKFLHHMYYNSTLTSMIHVNNGLQYKLPIVQQELEKLLALNDTDTTDYYILFNAGLHEIAQMCLVTMVRHFSRMSKTPLESLGPCAERYRGYLTKLIHIVQAFPAKLAVFQTSVAAWSKWGNYGFGWHPSSGQMLQKSNQFVDYFNRIAWDLMQEYHVRTVDGYWRSVGRPDHREVTPENEIGAHLVHLGPELYDLFTREWTLLVVENDKERDTEDSRLDDMISSNPKPRKLSRSAVETEELNRREVMEEESSQETSLTLHSVTAPHHRGQEIQPTMVDSSQR